LIGIAAALRLLQLGRLHPVVWDEIEFFHATDWVRRGLVPYRDFWEHHTPLQWFVFAPIVALTRSPGVSAILFLRWAQLPLWILTFVLLAAWMRRAGASKAAVLVAVLLAICSTQFMLAAIEYRLDTLGCLGYVAGLFLLQRDRAFGAGVALCLAGLANMRLGPLLVVTVIVFVVRAWRPGLRLIAGGLVTFAAAASYFVFTHSAAMAIRRVLMDNYIGGRDEPAVPFAFFKRFATPFGLVAHGFDAGAIDAGSIVVFFAAFAATVYVLWARRRTRDDLWILAVLQTVNFLVVATMKYIYHYHFLIVTLLALPFVALACDAMLARGRTRVVAGAVAVALAVSVYASVFRGKEDDLDYQDVIMREADRLIPPGGRVFDGVGYAIRREPAYRYWFLAALIYSLERNGTYEHYDIEADPPAAVIADVPTARWLIAHPRLAEFVRRHYLPRWPELLLPGMNARLTPQRPSQRWIVPVDGMYDVHAPPGLQLTVDGIPHPASGRLTLRRRQRLEVSGPIMQPTDVFIVPAGDALQFHRPPRGVTLDALVAPQTHLPRLW
jgi:hypothetical protein